MSNKRNIIEAMICICLLSLIIYWRKEWIFNFLTNAQFLYAVIRLTSTLSGLCIALLGFLLALPEPGGSMGEAVAKDIAFFSPYLRRCTGYFLLSLVLAFLPYIFFTSLYSRGSEMISVDENVSLTMTLCSALSTILFLDGLSYLVYVFLGIQETLEMKLKMMLRSRADKN